MKKLLPLMTCLFLVGFQNLVFAQVVLIENNTSVGSCTPSTQNVYFFKSGITGSFTVKLYQVIDKNYYFYGCNSNIVSEVASSSGSTSPLALSIPANLEETKTERPFGSGPCFLPPPNNYYYRTVSYYLKIVSDVDNNVTNQRNFGIGGSCSTPGVGSITIPQPNICPGNTTTIDFTHNGINVGNVFTISIGNIANPLVSTTIAGNTATSATLTIPANASNDNYAVNISTSNPSSSVSYSNAQVRVNTSYCPPPSPPTITANPTTVCAGNNVALTATSCTGIVNWSDGGTGSTRTATFSSSNNLTATCTLGGTSGNSNSIPITVNSLPNPPTASGISISAGSTASITASGCTTYNWYEDSESGGGFLFTGNPFITPILTTNTTYRVACQSGSCISNRTSVTVTVASPPAQPGNFTTSTNAVCQGLTGIVYTVPNVSGVTYNWSYSGTGTTINGSGNSILIDFANNATSGNLSVTATNSAGTSPTRTLAITVNAFPSSAPTASGATIASGSTASLTASGCSTYNWYGQATGGTALQSSISAGFITPTLNANTTYHVACANGTCESSRTSVLVTVTGSSSAVLVAHYPFCGNANDVTANANNGIVNGATLISDRFGNANSAYNFDGNDFISTLNLATSKTDNWAMTAWVRPSSINQNMGTIMLNGFDNESFGNGYGMLMADGANGTGNTLTGLFSGVSFYNSGGIFSINNSWYHITMTRISGVTKFYINGIQTPNTSSTNPASPVGSLIIGSMNGVRFWNGAIDDVKVYSSGLTTIEVQSIYANESVNNAPTITASSNSPQCVGSTINLTSSGGSTYTWNGPNMFTATGINPSIINVTTLAIGTYTVTGVNSFGCTNTATTSVIINLKPTSRASSNSPQCVNGTLNLNSSGGTSYTWTGVNSFTSTAQNPSISSVTSAATGTYMVTVANVNGCTNTATTSVIISTSGTPSASGVTISSGSTASIIATGCTTYKWYDLSTAGTLLFTGNPFVTPTLTTNTTYYVACSEAPCSESSRTAVLVTVSTGPPQPGAIVGGNSACQGRLGLTYLVPAVAGATSYTWTYSGTGVSFVGGISNTRTITLDFSFAATAGTLSVTANNVSGSSPATTLAISVNAAPPAPTASGVTIAQGATANLTATGCFIYKWYATATPGTTALFTGQNFTTPVLTSTTNYYVACNPGTSCESPRVLVTVTVPCTQMYTVKTGTWNDPIVWSCNRIPISTDMITVEFGHIVSVPAGTFQVKNITEKGTLSFLPSGIVNIVGGL